MENYYTSDEFLEFLKERAARDRIQVSEEVLRWTQKVYASKLESLEQEFTLLEPEQRRQLSFRSPGEAGSPDFKKKKLMQKEAMAKLNAKQKGLGAKHQEGFDSDGSERIARRKSKVSKELNDDEKEQMSQKDDFANFLSSMTIGRSKFAGEDSDSDDFEENRKGSRRKGKNGRNSTLSAEKLKFKPQKYSPLQNPLIKAVWKAYNSPYGKLSPEHRQLLRPEKILQWLEASIFDRVYIDLKTQKGNLEDRIVEPFYTFFYD